MENSLGVVFFLDSKLLRHAFVPLNKFFIFGITWDLQESFNNSTIFLQTLLLISSTTSAKTELTLVLKYPLDSSFMHISPVFPLSFLSSKIQCWYPGIDITRTESWISSSGFPSLLWIVFLRFSFTKVFFFFFFSMAIVLIFRKVESFT